MNIFVCLCSCYASGGHQVCLSGEFEIYSMTVLVFNPSVFVCVGLGAAA